MAKPASLLFTLYGDFAPDSAIPIAALVKLMAAFGLSDPAVRQAVSRLQAQDWLRPEKLHGRAAYALTERGRARVQSIAPRIYEPAAEWDGEWRLLSYSIAERRRGERERLRKDLTLLGFAPLAPGLWITPRDAGANVRAILKNATDDHALHFFIARHDGPRSDAELLAGLWDLGAIAQAYQRFIARYQPRLDAERHGSRLSDELAFRERLSLVQDFREFLYLDPGLPSALLPPHWPGSIASQLFREYYRHLERKAQHHFAAVTGGARA